MLGMPRAGKAVKVLLLINAVVFAVQLLMDQPSGKYPAGVLTSYLGATADSWWQIWRYFTCQFMHDPGDFWHILLNMLGLYILGTPIEQRFGLKRFVVFYLTCGVVAGVAYVVVTFLMGANGSIPIIGASGGVYALILAAAVYCPHIKLIFLFFPVPIRFACIIIFGGVVVVMLRTLGSGHPTSEFWSHVAHSAGALTAAFWIWVLPRIQGASSASSMKRKQGAWDKKMKQRADEQTEIDRILDKIKTDGLNSLTRREKSTLQQATKRQQAEEDRAHRL